MAGVGSNPFLAAIRARGQKPAAVEGESTVAVAAEAPAMAGVGSNPFLAAIRARGQKPAAVEGESTGAVAAEAPAPAPLFQERIRERRQSFSSPDKGLSHASPAMAVANEAGAGTGSPMRSIARTLAAAAGTPGQLLSTAAANPLVSPTTRTPAQKTTEQIQAEKQAELDVAMHLATMNSVLGQMRVGARDGAIRKIESILVGTMSNGFSEEFLVKLKAAWEAHNNTEDDQEKRLAGKNNIEQTYVFLCSNYKIGEYEKEIPVALLPGQRDDSVSLTKAEKDAIILALSSSSAVLSLQPAGIEGLRKLISTSDDAPVFTKQESNTLQTFLKSPAASLAFSQQEKEGLQATLASNSAFVLSAAGKETLRKFLDSPEEVKNILKRETGTLEKDTWPAIEANAQQVVGFALENAQKKYTTGIQKLRNSKLGTAGFEEKRFGPAREKHSRSGYKYSVPKAVARLNMVLNYIGKEANFEKYRELLPESMARLVTSIPLLKVDKKPYVDMPVIGRDIKGKADAIDFKDLDGNFSGIMKCFWPENSDKDFKLSTLGTHVRVALDEIFPTLTEENKATIVSDVCSQYTTKLTEYKASKTIAYQEAFAAEEKKLLKLVEIEERGDKDVTSLNPEEQTQYGKMKSLIPSCIDSMATINENRERVSGDVSEFSLQYLSRDIPNISGRELRDVTIRGLIATTVESIQKHALAEVKEKVAKLVCYPQLAETTELLEKRAEMDAKLKSADDAVRSLLAAAEGLSQEATKEKLRNNLRLSAKTTARIEAMLTSIGPESLEYPQLYAPKNAEALAEITSHLAIASGQITVLSSDGKVAVGKLITAVQDERSKREEKERQLQEQAQQLAEFKEQSNLPDEEWDKLVPLLTQVIKTIGDYRGQISDLAGENDDLQAEVSGLKKENAALRRDNSELVAENAGLQEETSGLQEEKRAIIEQVRNIRDEVVYICAAETPAADKEAALQELHEKAVGLVKILDEDPSADIGQTQEAASPSAGGAGSPVASGARQTQEALSSEASGSQSAGVAGSPVASGAVQIQEAASPAARGIGSPEVSGSPSVLGFVGLSSPAARSPFKRDMVVTENPSPMTSRLITRRASMTNLGRVQ